MPRESTKPASTLSNGTNAFVIAVALAGLAVVALSTDDLLLHFQRSSGYRNQWLALVGLTIASGLLPVRVPTLDITLSVSETFVIAGTLLFGRSGGTVLVLVDAVFMTMYCSWSKRLRWQQVLFNLGVGPVSIWLAAVIAHIEPRFRAVDTPFVLQLTVFTVLDYSFNTALLSCVLALQQRVSPKETWLKLFRELVANYAAGGSIAALLVYNSRELRLEVILTIVPLLVIMFLTYRWFNGRIEAERERNADLNRVFLSTIEALALAIDAKDQVTHGHIRRVQRYTMALAEALGVNDERELDAIRAAALLHDTGKLAVPEYILNKPGPLTSAEFERMKVHAAVGADILKSINFPYPVEPIVRHHHENWNGTGYPSGLKGQEIPVGARILSVVDCYDALTSDRPYRPRYNREHAEQVLLERRGTWYDPWVIDEFLRILDQLELADAEDARHEVGTQPLLALGATQLGVIAATTAEEREFNELRRELPLANGVTEATEIVFRHLRRVIPAANLTVFVPLAESGNLRVLTSIGVGTSAVDGLEIEIGSRISGWALAHKQAVVNSNATLELGSVARTFSTPLRYALAVPMLSGAETAIGVVTCYGTEPFSNDHTRVLESAATLFKTTILTTPARPVGATTAAAESGRVH
jgi:putative nucleotidyltransferase with HDIG domain